MNIISRIRQKKKKERELITHLNFLQYIAMYHKKILLKINFLKALILHLLQNQGQIQIKF